MDDEAIVRAAHWHVHQVAPGLSPSDHDDVAQEVAIEIWRAHARVDPDRGSGAALFHHRARGAIRDWMRRERLGRLRWSRARGEPVEETTLDDVEPAVVDDLSTLDVRLLLADLTPRYRAFVVCAASGMNDRETAEILGVSESTVRQRRSALRAALSPPARRWSSDAEASG